MKAPQPLTHFHASYEQIQRELERLVGMPCTFSKGHRQRKIKQSMQFYIEQILGVDEIRIGNLILFFFDRIQLASTDGSFLVSVPKIKHEPDVKFVKRSISGFLGASDFKEIVIGAETGGGSAIGWAYNIILKR